MENNLGQCFTSFFKFNDSSEVMEEPLYLQELIDKKFEGKFEVKVDSIFINKTVISLQLKLYCACLKPIQAKLKITMRVDGAIGDAGGRARMEYQFLRGNVMMM